MIAKKLAVRKRDNVFQRLVVLLTNREKRTRYGEFLVEGVLPINRLVERNWQIRALLYSSDRPLSAWAQQKLESVNCLEQIDLACDLLAEISQKEESSELIAVASFNELELSRLSPKQAGVLLVLDRPNSPGNLGSSIRSAEAFGADAVIVTGHAADIYDPQTIRSSRGAQFCLPVVRTNSHKEITEWISAASAIGFSYQIIGTDADVSESIAEVDLTIPTVVVMGNESSGLSRGYRDLCTKLAKIPMVGSSDSINVSCAASICLYELVRQRGIKNPAD